MTVKELREKLAGFPEEMVVCYDYDNMRADINQALASFWLGSRDDTRDERNLNTKHPCVLLTSDMNEEQRQNILNRKESSNASPV